MEKDETGEGSQEASAWKAIKGFVSSGEANDIRSPTLGNDADLLR